jgi:glycosyltransferase involved in cell wall biosynthesis
VCAIDLKASRALKSFVPAFRLLRHTPNVPLLIFGFEYGFGMAAAKRVGWIKAPLIYREGNSPSANVRPHLWLGYRFLIAHADVVIAQSPSIKRELETLGVAGTKIRVIPNPIQEFSPRVIARTPACASDAILILAMGRLEPQKAFDRLIRAFADFHRREPTARLVILGEGAERKRLEQLVQSLGLDNCASMPGFTDNPEEWLLKADLFVLSSHFEGQPNALIEAILHECPVLCTHGKGGVADLLTECGLEDCLVAPSQFELSFCKAVQYVLAKDAACWKKARERLIDLFDPIKVSCAYLEACGLGERTRQLTQQLSSTEDAAGK